MVLGSDTITIYQPTMDVDPDGSVNSDSYFDVSNTDTATVVTNCSVQPFLMADKLQLEDNLDRAFTRTTYRVFAPPGTRVTPEQWVGFDSEIYEVFGFPGVWRNRDGSEHHVEFIIKLRRG